MKQWKKQINKILHQDLDEVVNYYFFQTKKRVYSAWKGFFESFQKVSEGLLALLPKTRTSNPFSKLLRPALQHRRLKTILGANLTGAMILVGSVSASPGDLESFPEAETQVISEETVMVTTQTRFQKPFTTTGISQGFYRFHRGVDLRAPIGTVIKPIAPGEVIEVVYGRFGYGHYVLVAHGNNMASLYAHMGIVRVNAGDKVTRESHLGTVGTTGWSTGSHLHLEIYDQGVALNPKQVVDFYEETI